MRRDRRRHPAHLQGGNRAVADSNAEVYNQFGEHVMTYTARRMLAGRAA